MSDPSRCPDVPTLQRLLLGQVAVAEADQLEAHFAGCSRCGSTAGGVRAEDTLVEALRGLAAATPAAAREEVHTLIDRLKSLNPQPPVPEPEPTGMGTPEPSAAEEFTRDDRPLAPPPADPTQEIHQYLSPPRGPEELGRLGGYRVLKVLGQGGMGMVFLAQDVQLDRPVALKVMKPSVALNPQAKARFLREARACAALKHDHIITIYQVGEERNCPFLAMEFLEGSPLDQWLSQGRKLTLAQILRIGREIARGLAAAHDKGLIHRDIKPGNIWLDKTSGRVKILDFGLARTQAEDVHLTQSGMIVGTPAYMAPEQARSEPIDARTDLFSLGCVLYRLTTGQLPFRGETTMAVLMALGLETQRPVREINPAVPAALSDLIDRLLSKDPADRPKSAREVMLALQDIERKLVGGTTTVVTAPVATPILSHSIAAPNPFADLTDAVETKVKPASGGRQPPEKAPAPARGADTSRSPGRAPGSRRRGLLLATAAAMLAAALAAGIWLIIRDKDGNEIARLKLREGDTVATQRENNGPPPANVPPQQAKPPASVQPFVLLAADGTRRGEYQTLTDALADQKDADTIEIHGNGPFVVGNVNTRKGLNLRAAPGYRPRIISAPDSDHWWLAITGKVRIEGCDFVANAPVDLSFVGDGPYWEFRNCRILSSKGNLIQFAGPRLRLQDCLLAGLGRTALVAMSCPNPAELELTNNVIIGQYIFTLGTKQASPMLNARLERNTIFGSVARLFSESRVAVTATANLFAYPSRLLSLSNSKDKSMTWEGRGNVYPDVPFIKQTIDDTEVTLDMAGWKQFAGVDDRDGRTVDVQFAWLARRDLGPKLSAANWNRLYPELLQAIGDLAAKPDKPWDQVEPAIGDPRSWRVVPPMKDVGADVDRVATSPVSAASPADKINPFVLVRAGQPPRAFKSLGGALAESKDGDAIEIHANAPLSLGGLEQIGKPLKLRAGAGYRPRLVLPHVIKVDNAALDVEGCDLDARLARFLFQGFGPLWELRRCRIWGGVVIYTGPRLRLADCLVVSGEHGFLRVNDCAVEVDNCLTNVKGAVVQVNAGKATIRLTNSTFAITGFGADNAVSLHANAEGASVDAAGNLFYCNNSYREGPLARFGELKRIRWQGRDNLYAGSFAIEKNPGEVVQGFAEWNKLLDQPEENSREAPELTLEWSRPGSLDWPATRALYQPQVAIAMQRHGFRELGPDWDLIGPGAAYVQALVKASGRPLPKDQLRPEAPNGQPVVILRGGKVAASFRTVQDAADAALDGDVIELRSDGQMGRVAFRGKDRQLTLRAAPGYTPVIDHLHSKDRLSLEGIAIADYLVASQWGGDPKGFTGEQAGSFQRVANCFLPATCSGLFLGRDGQPPEVVNCWIRAPMMGGVAELPLSISNSVLSSFRVETLPGKPATVVLDRCVLANPAPAFPALYAIGFIPRQAKPMAVSVKRSFVQAPDALVHLPPEVVWEGAGNVYRVPRSWSHGKSGGLTLDVWRAQTRSDAGSVEEVPAQFDPAQWRVRSDSPGYVKRADGRDFGADVSRILASPVLPGLSFSPLDALRRADISALDLANAGDGDPAKAPPELVAVYGDSRWTLWGPGVRFAGLSDDGNRLAIAGRDGMARVWDVASGRILCAVPGPLQANADLSPDGKLVAVSGEFDQTNRAIWDVDSGKIRHHLKDAVRVTRRFRFSPDGKRLLAWGHECQCWDPATGQKVGAVKFEGGIATAEFSPDSQLVVLALQTGKVSVYKADLSAEVRALAPVAESRIDSFAVSPDGKAVAAASFPNASGDVVDLILWDAGTGQIKRTAPGQKLVLLGHRQIALRFGADNDTVQFVSAAGMSVWDREGVRVTAELKSGPLTNLYQWWFSRDGKLLAGGGQAFHGRGLVIRAVDGKPRADEPLMRSPARDVAISRDGRLVAAMMGGQAIQSWDLPSAGPGRAMALPVGGSPETVAFLPDGSTILTGGDFGRLMAWNAVTGKERPNAVAVDFRPFYVALAQDGQTVAASEGKLQVQVGDLATGKWRRLPGDLGKNTSLAISPSGQYVAAGDGPTVKLWDATANKELRTIPVLADGSVEGLAFSPDGQVLAVAAVPGQPDRLVERRAEVKLFNVADGRALRSLADHQFGCKAVAFSPDGKTLASAGMDRTVRLWDHGTGVLKREIPLGPNQRGFVNSLAWAADGRHLLTANGNGTVYVLRLSPPHAAQLPIDDLRRDAIPAEELAAAGGGDAAKAPTNLVAVVRDNRTTNPRYAAVAVSPDGKTLATSVGSKWVKLWDLATGRELHALPAAESSTFGVTALAFSPDSKTLASALHESNQTLTATVKVWDVASGKKLLTLAAHKQVATAVAYSPDGTTLATSGNDGTVVLWDATTGERKRLLKHGDSGWMDCIAFSPDGKTLASRRSRADVKLWNVPSGDELLTLDVEQSLGMMAFSPDGKSLATAVKNRMVLWDAATGQQFRTLTIGGPFGLSATFNASWDLLATGHSGYVQTWDVASGQVRGQIQIPAAARLLAFSSEGRHLVTANSDGTVYVLRLAPLP